MKFRDDVGGESSDNKNFLKLKDKDAVKGVFRGDVHEFSQHWVQGQTGRTSKPCLGDGCPICLDGNKASFRFMINFIVNENGSFVAKTWEQGSTVYCQLRDLQKSGYDLEKTVMVIRRTGSGPNDTSYTILPDPKSPFTPVLEQKLAQVKLNDFTQAAASEKPQAQQPDAFLPPAPVQGQLAQQGDQGRMFTEDDIPF